jgi:biopolymer transport protein TolR
MADEIEQLSASQRSRVRRLSAPKELAPDEEGGELNIVPFLDIIMNVLMFVLATVAVTFTAIIDTQPPRPAGASAAKPTTPTLSLNVIILKDGYIMSAVGQRIGAGCQGTGNGLAVGLDPSGKTRAVPVGTTGTFRDVREYDYHALSECAARLKGASPDFATEKQVVITTGADMDFQAIINTMDALRKSDKGDELFPEVMFGVPK